MIYNLPTEVLSRWERKLDKGKIDRVMVGKLWEVVKGNVDKERRKRYLMN